MLEKFMKELAKEEDYDLSEISSRAKHDCLIYPLKDREVNLFKTLKRLKIKDLDTDRKLGIKFLNIWRELFWVHIARVLGISNKFPLKVVRDDKDSLFVALKNPKDDAVRHIFLHSNLRSIPVFPYLLNNLMEKVTQEDIDNHEPGIAPREDEEEFGELNRYLKKLFVVSKGFFDDKKDMESYFSKKLFKLEVKECYPEMVNEFSSDPFEVAIRKGWKVVARKLNTFFIDFSASAHC